MTEIYFLFLFSLGRQVCDYASSPEPPPSRSGTIPGPGTGHGLAPWLGVHGGQGPLRERTAGRTGWGTPRPGVGDIGKGRQGLG